MAFQHRWAANEFPSVYGHFRRDGLNGLLQAGSGIGGQVPQAEGAVGAASAVNSHTKLIQAQHHLAVIGQRSAGFQKLGACGHFVGFRGTVEAEVVNQGDLLRCIACS